MKMLFLILLAASALVLGYFILFPAQFSAQPQSNESDFEQRFMRFGLKTNTAKTSIPLEEVVSGGPGKGGIPAITAPLFTSVSDRSPTIENETLGLVVGDKFYPYNILVWHEIVNDEFEGTPIAVTFCPLCGSAIVFSRSVNGEVLEFGVSGLLYQSNLLMFDSKTESLWSQVLGKGVVGDNNGTSLGLVESAVMTMEQFSKSNPDGKVLSTNTGYSRDYSYYPYGNYDKNNEFYFPLGKYDDRLPAKEIVFALRVDGKLLLFPIKQLALSKAATAEFEGKRIDIIESEGIIKAKINGEPAAGYYAMYFSIVVHEPDARIWAINGIR